MTAPRTVPRAVLAASMTLCLAACGSADAPPAESGRASAGAPVDACTLVTGDEIRAAVGVAVGDPQHAPSSMPGGPISICQWARADADTFMPYVQVSITPNAASSYDAWMEGMARDLGEKLDPAENRRVDGIGDWGVYVEDGRMLMVGSGRRLVQVMVPPGSGEAEATTLARHALGRLP